MITARQVPELGHRTRTHVPTINVRMCRPQLTKPNTKFSFAMTGLFLIVTCGRIACALPLFIGNPGFGRGGQWRRWVFDSLSPGSKSVRYRYRCLGRKGGLSAGCWLDLLELGEQFQGHMVAQRGAVRYGSRLHRYTIPDSAEEKGKGGVMLGFHWLSLDPHYIKYI